MFVRRTLRQFKADQGHDGAGGIGQVVHGVSRNGHRPGQGSHQQLEAKQQQITYDAHDTRKLSHRAPDPGIVRCVGVLYKQAKQQFRHVFSSKTFHFGTLPVVESRILPERGRIRHFPRKQGGDISGKI